MTQGLLYVFDPEVIKDYPNFAQLKLTYTDSEQAVDPYLHHAVACFARAAVPELRERLLIQLVDSHDYQAILQGILGYDEVPNHLFVPFATRAYEKELLRHRIVLDDRQLFYTPTLELETRDLPEHLVDQLTNAILNQVHSAVTQLVMAAYPAQDEADNPVELQESGIGEPSISAEAPGAAKAPWTPLMTYRDAQKVVFIVRYPLLEKEPPKGSDELQAYLIRQQLLHCTETVLTEYLAKLKEELDAPESL